MPYFHEKFDSMMNIFKITSDDGLIELTRLKSWNSIKMKVKYVYIDFHQSRIPITIIESYLCKAVNMIC